jgi:hypothetical protein
MSKYWNLSTALFLTICAAPVVIGVALANEDKDSNNHHERSKTTSCAIDSTAGQTGQAGSIDTQKIGRIFTSSGKAPQMSPSAGAWVFFGVTPNTSVRACNYFGLQFRFDSGTPDGKALLSTLLYAKAAGKYVDINYCSPAQLGLPIGGNCNDLTQVTIAGAIGVRD